MTGFNAAVVTIAFVVGHVAAFVTPFLPASQIVAPQTQRCQRQLHMGGAQGARSTRAGKAATVKSVQEVLEGTEMIFAIQSSVLRVNEYSKLRKTLPTGTKAMVVKNKLMRVATEGTQFAAVKDTMLKGENLWFFVKDDIPETIKTLKGFLKDISTKDRALTESHMPKYGVLEGEALDATQVDEVSKLPSKKELYQKIAFVLREVPTKLARGINQVPTKIARGVKLASEKEGTFPEGSEGSEASEA